MEYFEYDESIPKYGDEHGTDDSERGKRQVRYYLKNGYKTPGKSWGFPKAVKLVDLHQYNYQNPQGTRLQQNYDESFGNSGSPKPYLSDNFGLSGNSYQNYQIDNAQSERPFKPSLRDPGQSSGHNPVHVATHIITKSPPISSLKNNENPFASLAGGFYNNAPKQSLNQNPFMSQFTSFSERPNHKVAFPDSSQLSSTVITGKPVLVSTTGRTRNNYKVNPQNNDQSQHHERVPAQSQDEDYESEEESSEENESSENSSSEKEEKDSFKPNFEPPYEFTHPSHRFRDIENPFANPNFDFDAFLTKLSGGQYAVITTEKPKQNAQNAALKTLSPPVELTTSANPGLNYQSSTLNYKGMSTPRPFLGGEPTNFPSKPSENLQVPASTKQTFAFEQWSQRPTLKQQNAVSEQQSSLNQNIYRIVQQNAGIPLDAVRPKLKPPNFKDERQLPINYSFNRPIESTIKPNYDVSKQKGEHKQTGAVTQSPYVLVTDTGAPAIFSTPKQQYFVKPEKILALHPQSGSTGKPYLVSTGKPNNGFIAFKSTPKPLTTIANEQLAALRNYWRKPTSESYYSIVSTPRPSGVSEMPKLENLFLQTLRPSGNPVKSQSIIISKDPITTTSAPAKRRPIPKPSPEMNDYYYEDDEEYYEPPVKSKYMPSTEVRPQRPPMAQNYKEYDDSSEEANSKRPLNLTPSPHHSRRPTKFSLRPETVTKNYNDVSVVTKGPIKNYNKNVNGKILIPVLVNYATPTPTVLIRPEISNYEIIHHNHRNRTVHIRKPTHSESGPYTMKPPKYLNQTTLRPYTVRHRLAKPTTVSDTLSMNDDNKQTRGRIRHQNIVAQMKHTTPRDSHNQETRYTKTKHDDKTNR